MKEGKRRGGNMRERERVPESRLSILKRTREREREREREEDHMDRLKKCERDREGRQARMQAGRQAG